MADFEAPAIGALLDLRLGDWGSDASARSTGPSGVEVRVADGIPGERVRARVTGSSQGAPLVWAQIEELLEEPPGGPTRREAPCPLHGLCGGCGLQHVPDEAQLALKVRGASAGLPAALRAVLAPEEDWIQSPSPFDYRHKAVLLPDLQDGRAVLGAFARRSHDVVDLPDCAVLAPALRAARAELAEALAPEIESGRLPTAPPGKEPRGAPLRALVLRADRSGRVLCTFVVGDRRAKKRLRPLAARLVKGPGPIAGAFMQVRWGAGDAVLGPGPALLLAGSSRLEETIGGVALELGPLAFFQVNPDVLERLVERAASALPAGGNLLDLYCGGGAFGLGCAAAIGASGCSGVDVQKEGVAAATRAAGKMGLPGAFVEGTPAERIPELQAEHGPFDAVLVDPPRAGCAPEDLAALLATNATRLVYVSCSATSLARDAELLLAAGWEPESLLPADMIPQTPHVEWLAVFRRAAAAPLD